jgi:dihydroxy-acid dehydratase
MQEMLKPTMSLKAQKVDDSCALITDGRYSGVSLPRPCTRETVI